MPKKKARNNGNILIIDDEKDILSSLRNVLEEKGYEVYVADDGNKGFHCIENLDIDLIFLDIWLPVIDGLEILSKMPEHKKNIPVIMMSGHAGLESAVRATKLGASDFIEKPFSIKKIISLCEEYIPRSDTEKEENKAAETKNHSRCTLEKSKSIFQKTIGKSIVLSGYALMGGRKTAMQLLPAPPNNGITFIDIVSGTNIRLSPENIQRTAKNGHANSTVLVSGDKIIRTTEHFLGALHMYGITNLIVKCDEEVPNTDGSALDFCEKIEEAGTEVQNEKMNEILITEPLIYGTVDENETYMKIYPYDGFEIDLRISFPPPIDTQKYKYTFTTTENFKNEIASARSFNTMDNIQMAQKNGIVGAGMMDSHIIIKEDKVINTMLRFDDEYVRHKILDIIGDLYILGMPFRGRIEANKTSHAFNHSVVMDLAKSYGYF